MKTIILLLTFGLHIALLNAQTKNELNNKNNELSKNELKNITVFAKAFGIVRYFHPSTEVNSFNNWDEFLVYSLNEIKEIKSDKEFINKMNTLFKPLAPSIIFSAKKEIPNPNFIEKSDSVCYRKNIGWGNKGRNASRKFTPYKSTIEVVLNKNLPKFLESPESLIKYKLSKKVNLFLPQTLWYKNQQSIPKSNKNFNFKINNNYSVETKNVRLGSIIMIYNVMQHFYPYLKTMHINNDKILKKYLKKTFVFTNENDFYELLQKMTAEYKDGHSLVTRYDLTKRNYYSPPIRVKIIENKTIVINTFNPKIDIKIGDEIIKINSVRVKDFFRKERKKHGGSTKGFIDFETSRRFLTGLKNSFIDITYFSKKENKIKKITLERNIKEKKTKPDSYSSYSDVKYIEYKKSYFYINMKNVNDSILGNLMSNQFIKAKGLIFDLRNSFYGKKDKLLLGHFSKDTLKPQPWTKHIYYFPNQLKYNIEQNQRDYGSWIIPPQTPSFTKNVVFLMDNQMYSGRESYLAIIDHYNLGKTIGGNSGGTNGNTSIFNVFRLYAIFYTGMEVFQYDGSTFHGIGIKPNIYVKQKLKDFYNGEDSFIEEAKKYLDKY